MQMKCVSFLWRCMLLCVLMLTFTASMAEAAGVKKKSELPLADPYVFVADGKYYAYGTHSDNGIEVYSSDDLKVWKYETLALDKRNTTESRWFWAPEVYYLKGKYVMYYSANEHIYVASADSPLGPFKQIGNSPLLAVGSIDTSLFIDDDGTPYLFFVKFSNGNVIYMAEMEENLASLKYETMRMCLQTSQPWESDPAFPGSCINEGPFVLKHAGMYYLTYSANDFRSKRYGVGISTSKSLKGEWVKSGDNPIFQNVGDLVGTGHHSFFTDKKGRLWMIFHAHFSDKQVGPRLSYFVRAKWTKDGRLVFGKKIISPRLQAKP